MLEGALSIAEGINPMLIRSKLEAYQHGEAPQPQSEKHASAADARAVPVR